MNDATVPVLVVDDTQIVRELVLDILKEMGLAAHGVEDVSAAKKWLSRHVPPLIIADIMMPDGNGLDLCRWVRSQNGIKSVPIIVMTGIKDDETAQDALLMGAMDFIRKPVAMSVLQDKINRFIPPTPGD
jgi:two-component system response regulator PilR (NtrC family)